MGLNITEDNDMLILMNLIRRYLASNDLAENTIRHERLLPYVLYKGTGLTTKGKYFTLLVNFFGRTKP